MKSKQKKILFVYNPKAGKAKIKTHLSDIIEVFNQARYEIIIYATQKQYDAKEIVTNIEKDTFYYIVCSGGDGTLDEVVTGMLEGKVNLPIGYIPAGSTNDFAKRLEISSNMVDAAREIIKENIFKCDVGKFNEDAFVYIAAFGLFTEVSYNTDQQLKNSLGHMAYILEGIKSLSSIKSYQLQIQSDELCESGEFIYGMISNSVSVGGFKNLTGKDVELNDGMFEVTLVKRPQNILELNEIATAFMTQKLESKHIVRFKTSSLNIKSEEEVQWTLDGEYGGEHKHVCITNLPQAIGVLCNKYNTVISEE